ncbi:LysE family translocator [Actinomadura chibensis]|uniref:LysE family translocator n=1 Tax=Actinomadura chibensis TaxID=392828 RepID=A0A5D0NAA8_9ACTN|nr:LysE family translocator [Actinomadura chibensis]TYB41380.1 LysE family translocator [Actinomadura chibensis]
MLGSLVAFAGAAVLIAMAPGPSTVVIMRVSVRSGRRAGLAAVLGNETGVLVWGVAAAVGLSALLAASRLAYDGLRVAGAAVLVWFGVRALWHARRRVGDDRDDGVAAAGDGGPGDGGAGDGGGPSGWRWYRLGLVTNFANPKAGVFAVSFLPQFVPDGWPVPVVLVGFSVLWALIDLAWYAVVVWLAGAARRVLVRPVVRRRLDQVSGVVLVGLGVRLAAATR